MKTKFEFGAEIDLVSPHELHTALNPIVAAVREREKSRKYRRMPQLSGVASGGVLDIGGDNGAGTTWNGNPVGPAQGWAWDIGLLSVTGLTAGGTPDIVNLYINGAGSQFQWWQFNGNSFAYTFGRGELIVLPGETLRLLSVGTFNATGRITMVGSVRSQVPAERIGGETGG